MKHIYLILVVIALAGCSDSLNREEYVAWIQDPENGLHVIANMGEYQYDLQHQPADYVLLQRSEGRIAAQDHEQQKREVESIQYYRLTINVADKKTDFINHRTADIASKQEKLYYFSYQFQQGIHLEENGEVLPCVLFHFEKGVDLRPGRTFVLGFENPHADSKECKLVLNSDWLQSEPVSIRISKQPIPALAL